ncbi:sigma 54-interacting transcriptional regulator [Candidatus Halobeggiatoa sp. HSG11]|nr:sigma 54-interacting transcriptional regulator [Candidatus Halobeggiatoa sp. HSG11]
MTSKILIVDNETDSLNLMRDCLRDANFKVLMLKSGKAALKRVKHIKPDLILLDIMMPKMDGFETCRRLKQDEVTQDIPIIFLTAKTEIIDKIEGFEIGAVDYITKPYQTKEVIARVNKHLTISNLRKQLEEKNAQLQDYVYHLESLASLGKAINETQDVTQMMDNAMQATLTVFKCDRAWLLYPCDPNAESWRVPVEVTTSEYPGANILNTDMPMDPATSEIIENSLSATRPIAFGPEYEHKLSSYITELFSIQSLLCMAIYPKIGKPWLFGIHQCSHTQVWTDNEVKLFQAFGQQIAISLGLSISVEELHKAQSPRERYHDFIGASLPMQVIYQTIDNVADSQASILITGESGTGKELCAEAIYKASKYNSFVLCNCAVIPRNLLESHLFGHVKGAFTGATCGQRGLVSQIDGGILFLDEISELSLSMQSSLLRFVQTNTFSKVGSLKIEQANVRLICATNKDLQAEIKAGRFRDDLYFRIDTVEIKLPTLQEREQDILLLAKFFLHKFAEQEQKDFQSFNAEAEEKLLSYEWPGNVRQLQHTIHNAVLLNQGKIITVEMLAVKIDEIDKETSNQDNSLRYRKKLLSSHIERFSNDNIRPFADIEKEVILKTIEYCDGNVVKAAKLLKIGQTTVYRKQQKWKTSKE